MATTPQTDENVTNAPKIERRAEYNAYDRPTGYDFYICLGCGIEAMHRSDVEAHCKCGGL